MSAESWMKEFYPVDANKVSEKDAIKHSLVKWYGLRKENLEKHGLTELPIYVDGDTCALCVNYYGFNGCPGCPLNQFLESPCDKKGMPYNAWNYGQGTPEPMIAALEAISFVEDVCK